MTTMRGKLQRRHFLLAQLAWAPAWLLEAEELFAESSYVVVPVVSSDSPLRDIALGTLTRVFLSEPVNAPDGRRFVPFNHPPKTRARVLFDQRVLNMNPDEVARHWVDQRIRGTSKPPRSVPTVELLKEVVHSFPGSISYLATTDLDSSVRPLTVQGIAHDAPNYPIR